MPQFNFAYFLPQMAWLAGLFAVLYFLIVRATLPKLGKVMQEREDKVGGDIVAAESAKAESDNVIDAYHSALRKVQEEARTLLASARSDAQKDVEGRLHEADVAIGAKVEAAQSALEAARSRAAGEIQAIAADAAGSIVERLTGTRPADDKAKAAAQAALAKA
jgi:F-type H+-transporting ATPase subunit b